jgi:hypothetical protein
VLAGLVGPVGLAGPAVAGPVDAGWVASGPGASTTSDGSNAAAAMSYNADGSGSASWTFTTTSSAASADGTPIKVPWTWQGLHAWFEVTTKLEMVVDGNAVQTLVNQGPVDCCTSPSNGFIYGGVASFIVPVGAGHTYGFRLSGSNQDFNNFLRGTFTLSTKPYLDATIGTDNRDWPGAVDLPPGGITGKIVDPGEARWFKFPVVPGERVSVDLTQLPADYDVALYGDIGAAFDQLSSGQDITQLAAASAAGAPGSETQVPGYPSQTTDIPTSTPPTNQFAPRIYAPRIYAPRIYAPRIYAPRIYAPRIYAPRIYAPDSYQPDLSSVPDFSQAFSAAQNQTLLAVSANAGSTPENVSAATGNTDGYFYVRVQGHTDQVADPVNAFSLSRDLSGGSGCAGLQDFSGLTLLPPPTENPQVDHSTVIVTDSGRIEYDSGDPASYLDKLQQLADQTDGLVVDVKNSPRVQALWDQAKSADFSDCAYAVNLVAGAIKDIVAHYRNDSSKYVVIAGGDDVIPFFRYPDVSGLGEESQFSPPMREGTQSQTSLASDQVLSQDAYGSNSDVTIGGATLPVPQLAVGRLVKTASEIEGTVDNYLGLDQGTLPAPTSSLVTGYDFLADAAHAVNDQFTAALPASGSTEDTLISDPGDPSPWTGSDLRDQLLGSTHHDVVFLAGHFSANDTLAADFSTTVNAEELDPTFEPDPVNDPGVTNADKLKNTLVLSAGCHSGYNIVDGDAVANVTETADWTERMAQQHAVLIGGTGYQYGDSDFLEYSERLYLDVAKELHAGPTTGASPAIAVGNALALAKQDYLSGLSTVTGIDQKAMLEATLYGLPMTGFDAPNRTPVESDTSHVTTTPVLTGPGATLGLRTSDLPSSTFTTDTTERHKASNAESFGLPAQSTWLEGRDGVTIQPGAPALPKQIENVTVDGQVLRGVGFRSGDYTDKTGVLPVTGAPAIEGTTPNSTFDSSAFFPQRLVTPNYFGALGQSGRTSLILNPAQYRNDDGSPPGTTNTQRAYSRLGLQLFYSPSAAQSFGQNQPSLAAPPSIGSVQGTVDGGVVTFSVRAAGDPSAGVQQVWVTWTGGPDNSGHGTWASVDLTQNLNDSTLWTGTLNLPTGTSASDVRFLVQAANGVGAIGLDTAEGDGYRVTPVGQAPDTSTVAIQRGTPSISSPLGVSAVVSDQGSAVAGRTVRFSVYRAGTPLFSSSGVSGADGVVTLQLPSGQHLPSGRLLVVADLLDASDSSLVQDSASVEFVMSGASLAVTPTILTTRAGTAFSSGLRAVLTDARGPIGGVPVTFTLPTSGAKATFPGASPSVVQVITDPSGVAVSPVPTAASVVGAFAATVSVEGATDVKVPMAAQYAVSAFISPVTDPTTTSASGTTPIKATLLLADGSRLSDAASAALVTTHRMQIRWRLVGSTGAWGSTTTLTTYDASKHFFQSDLKASTANLVKGKSYTVVMRVLPATVDPQPIPEDNNRPFDLGSRSFTLTVK